nr:uncharacterized protein LOC118032166 [Populus alba]
MFSNIVATGQYAWAPSAGIYRDDNVGVTEDPNANDEQPDLEEGNDDSEEDGIPNFTNDMCNMVRGTHAAMEKEKKENVLTDKKGCSIPEVMTELHSIKGVHIGDDFHAYATEFLHMRRNREMWFSMGILEKKMKWLQKMFTRRKTP